MIGLLYILLSPSYFWDVYRLSNWHTGGDVPGVGTYPRSFGNLRVAEFVISFICFPDGHFVPRWTQWAAALLVLAYTIDIIVYEETHRRRRWLSLWFWSWLLQ